MSTEVYPPLPLPPPPYGPPRAAPRPRPPEPAPGAARRFVAGAALAAVTAGLLAWGVPVASLGMALTLLTLVVAAVAALGLSTRRALLPLLLAFALVPWLAVRASPWVVTLDLLAVLVAVPCALTAGAGGSLWESARGLVVRGWRVAEAVGWRAWPAAGRHVRVAARGRGWGRSVITTWAPGLVVMLVVVGAVTVLLATGDALFASFVDVGGTFASLPGRVALALVAAAAFAVLHVLGRGPTPAGPTRARPVAPPATAALVLGGLCVVYGLYVLTQVAAIALGPDYVEQRTGLTYAEYARQGFFQLLAVAVITLVLVSLARPIASAAGPRSRTAVRLLALVAILATEVMVVVSVLRLHLYADAFGLTMLRLYTTVFAGWMGVVLALAAVALWWSPREWLAPSVVALALVGVFTMNLVNPEGLVARQNLARGDASTPFDADYLRGLSSDAVPAVVAAARSASGGSAAIASLWCESPRAGDRGLSWNWSRHRADVLLTTLCS